MKHEDFTWKKHVSLIFFIPVVGGAKNKRDFSGKSDQLDIITAKEIASCESQSSYIGLIYGRYLQFRILKWRYVSTIFLAMFCWDIPETMAIDILNSSKTGHIVKAFVAFGGNELGTHLGPDFATLVETHLGQSTLTHHEGVPFITMA